MTGYSQADDCALLRTALENGGVELRFEQCESGGLARLAGRLVLFIPEGSRDKQRMELYLDALKKLAPTGMHLQPRIRQLLGEEEWNG